MAKVLLLAGMAAVLALGGTAQAGMKSSFPPGESQASPHEQAGAQGTSDPQHAQPKPKKGKHHR